MLITSALPYVNNIPHLGNIIGCVLSADVFARYCRSRGYETLFICGTDEYGTATEAKALEEGVTPKEICDRYHKIHKEVYEWFGIAFDHFGRTSTPVHSEITQDIFIRLHKNGFISEEVAEQPFDEEKKMFLADRFIEGKCPFCGSDGARADQCDKCGKLLTFAELINPISKLSGSKPVLRKSNHLFLDLPKSSKSVHEWIESTHKAGMWSHNSYSIASSWIHEGLKKRNITRDLKWGVPVPLKGFEDKVFYVWFDAPIGYISITANHTKDWKKWWKDPEGVRLYQFMGKDNVPFHTVIFPATLMGTQDGWTFLHHINTTEFLNYEGGKFSKSRNVGVFGDDAKNSGVPADAWRYYLLINRPELADTNFSWDDFGEKLNAELIGNLGNFVNRAMVFVKSKFDGVVPEPGALTKDDEEFLSEQRNLHSEITGHLENVRLKDALKSIMLVSRNANQYFQKSAPWVALEKEPEKARVSVHLLVNQAKDLAILIEPYLPHTSKEIFAQLGVKRKRWDDLGKLSVPGGHRINSAGVKPLFGKIEKKGLDSLRDRFNGKGKKQVQGISFYDVDLEVGEIIAIRKHQSAEKLYVEDVKLSDGVRQIVSGLVPFYKEDQLLGKRVVVVKNLKPAVLRGEKSEGMVLAVESRDKTVEVLSPSRSGIGEKLAISGEEKERGSKKPRPEITIDEFFSVKMDVVDGKVLHKGKTLRTDSEILSPVLLEGKVC